MKKAKGSLFRMLMSSYILFAFLMLLSFAITMIVMAITMTGSAQPSLDPYALASNPESREAEIMLNLGAWAEKLDAQGNVLEVRGNKPDSRMSYTQQEIYAMLDSENAGFGKATAEYRAYFWADGEYTWLVKFKRDAVQIQSTIMLSNYNSNNRSFYFATAIILVFFMLNCTLLSMYLRKRIRKPLLALGEGMRKIERGETDVNLDFKAHAEFEQIKDSFNIMSTQLQQEKQARADSESRKNRLLLDLSHDIKTPISTIKAYAHALGEGLVKPEEQGRYLKTIDEKASRVSMLASDLFTVLSMDDPEYPMNIQPIDAAELVREVCAAHYDEVEAKGLTLTPQIPETRIMVEGDEGLLRRALENLLGNAIKYNESGKYIRISLTAQKTALRIEVADDGEEITGEQQTQMFDAFTRGDKTRSTAEGTGLGLAITKSIAEKHGGSVEYQRKDEENVFGITLGMV